MYSPEEIRQEHDMPGAVVKTYGHQIEIDGHQAASFYCWDGSEEFLIIATEEHPGNTVTSRYDFRDIFEAGEGDFERGVLNSMMKQVSERAKDV